MVHVDGQLLPLGVRTFPSFGAPVVSGFVLPGELVETMAEWRPRQELNQSQTFLKLADGRGWVFVTHPLTGDTLLKREEGQLDY